MNKLIYFNFNLISRFDEFLFKKNSWFGLRETEGWPGHICSRSHQLDVPFALADTLIPIPKITNNETNFNIVLDQIAEKFCRQVIQTQRTPHIMWSGGIDSTAILVSLLKVASQEVLEQLVVVCDQQSIDENPYFYNRYIKNKLQTVDSLQFTITADNYNKMLLVSGDCAEMIFGSTYPYSLFRQNQLDLIHESWHNEELLYQSIKTKNPQSLKFGLEIVKESIQYSPVPIETIYDFLWWHYFNFKITDSDIRPTAYFTSQLTDEQAKDFNQNSYQKFFTYPEMQIWSMLTTNARRESMNIDFKYDAKKYIYEFDHNDFYYNNKEKYPSVIHVAPHYIFAIDENWRRYRLTDIDDRHMVGQWLNRI
jgi:hypothetical protein